MCSIKKSLWHTVGTGPVSGPLHLEKIWRILRVRYQFMVTYNNDSGLFFIFSVLCREICFQNKGVFYCVFKVKVVIILLLCFQNKGSISLLHIVLIVLIFFTKFFLRAKKILLQVDSRRRGSGAGLRRLATATLSWWTRSSPRSWPSGGQQLLCCLRRSRGSLVLDCLKVVSRIYSSRVMATALLEWLPPRWYRDNITPPLGLFPPYQPASLGWPARILHTVLLVHYRTVETPGSHHMASRFKCCWCWGVVAKVSLAV